MVRHYQPRTFVRKSNKEGREKKNKKKKKKKKKTTTIT